MSGRLAGKVAVITGGASGIGQASARRFSAEGANVCIADIDAARGESVAREVGGLFVQADVSKSEEVQRLYARAADHFGGIDILFNNAGIWDPGDTSILETSLETWERVIAINQTSVFLCCKYGIPYLQRRGGGSVINTASFVALVGAAISQIAYTASKGAVLAMTRELGVQFAKENIRVNALCPGPVSTPLLEQLFASDPDKAAMRLVHLPPGRFAKPEEVAAAAAFLASDDASFINATAFLVDGGLCHAYLTGWESKLRHG